MIGGILLGIFLTGLFLFVIGACMLAKRADEYEYEETEETEEEKKK